MDRDWKSGITGFFRRKPVRRALMLSGAYAAAVYFGVPLPEFLESLHAGFAHAISLTPLANPVVAASHYFGGVLLSVGQAGIDAAAKVAELGGELGSGLSSAVDGIRSDLSTLRAWSGETFDSVVRGVTEVATMWRNTISHASAPAREMIREGIHVAINDPGQAVEAVKDFVVSAVETFAVVKTIWDGYKSTFNKFLKRGARTAAVIQAAEDSGLSPNIVNNMTINVSISGTAGAETAASQIKAALALDHPGIVVDAGKLAATIQGAQEAVAEEVVTAPEPPARKPSAPVDEALVARRAAALKRFMEEYDNMSPEEARRYSDKPPAKEAKAPILSEHNVLLTSRKLNASLKGGLADRLGVPCGDLHCSFRPVEQVDIPHFLRRSSADQVIEKHRHAPKDIDAKNKRCNTLLTDDDLPRI